MPPCHTYHAHNGTAGNVIPEHFNPGTPKCAEFRGPIHARRLTPAQIRQYAARGSYVLSCVTSRIRCTQAEFCDDEWICREYGVMIPPLKRTGRPQRCDECRESKL